MEYEKITDVNVNVNVNVMDGFNEQSIFLLNGLKLLNKLRC
jgi:hypothetical protein